MTASEMGKKGGKNRWKNIPKEQRSEIMRRLAYIRWEGKEWRKKTTDA